MTTSLFWLETFLQIVNINEALVTVVSLEYLRDDFGDEFES